MGRLVLLLPLGGLIGLAGCILLLVASPGGAAWLPAAALAMLGISAASIMILARLAKLARDERGRVTEIDELVALRHYGLAAMRLGLLLSRPMRMGQARVLSLLQLARVLMRFDRFDDAIDVADALLADHYADPAIRFAAGCNRAMSLLRGGRLYDAGESISQLRRDVNRLNEAVRRLARGPEGQQDSTSQPRHTPERLDSVALTLVELYRDIQTRHSAEALATLDRKRTALRDGLGIHLGDALALGSVAAHRLGEGERAAQHWSDATCLVPESELRRRYPELGEVADTYAATQWPSESSGTGGRRG
jgi:hypothetical protein